MTSRRTSSWRPSTRPSGTPPATAWRTRRGRTRVRAWGSRAEPTRPTGVLVPVQILWVAPRLGVAWDVFGDGKTALRGGVGLFYERERVSTGLGAGPEPAVLGGRPRYPHARRQRARGRGRRSRIRSAGRGAGGEGSQHPHLAMERDGRARDLPQHPRRAGLRGQQRPRHVGTDQPERGAAREPPGLRPDRRCGAPAARRHHRHRQRRPRPLAARSQLDLPRPAGRAQQPVWPGVGARARLHLVQGHHHRGGGQRCRGAQHRSPLHRQHPAEPQPGTGRDGPQPRVQREPRPGPADAAGQVALREKRPRRLAVHNHRPGEHGLPRHGVGVGTGAQWSGGHRIGAAARHRTGSGDSPAR